MNLLFGMIVYEGWDGGEGKRMKIARVSHTVL